MKENTEELERQHYEAIIKAYARFGLTPPRSLVPQEEQVPDDWRDDWSGYEHYHIPHR